jgi:hypothetical protein
MLVMAVLLVPLSTPAFAVKGKWYTRPNEALAAARKAKKPVLAVAMDHA